MGAVVVGGEIRPGSQQGMGKGWHSGCIYFSIQVRPTPVLQSQSPRLLPIYLILDREATAAQPRAIRNIGKMP